MNAKQAFYLGLYDRTFGRPQGHGRQDFERWPENLQEAYVAGLDPTAKASGAVEYSQDELPSQDERPDPATHEKAQPEKSTLSKSEELLERLSALKIAALKKAAPPPASIKRLPEASQEDTLTFVLHLSEAAAQILDNSGYAWREPLLAAIKKLQEEQGLAFVVLKKSLEPEVPAEDAKEKPFVYRQTDRGTWEPFPKA